MQALFYFGFGWTATALAAKFLIGENSFGIDNIKNFAAGRANSF